MIRRMEEMRRGGGAEGKVWSIQEQIGWRSSINRDIDIDIDID